MEASDAGFTPVATAAPDASAAPAAPAAPSAPAAPAATVEQLQAQIAALQAAHEAANPTPIPRLHLVDRFKELAGAGVHIAERVRVLADEGFGKNSTVEGVTLELLDEIAKVVL
jgi:hypothetical protein